MQQKMLNALLLSLGTMLIQAGSPMIFTGSIQFPQLLEKLPSIRVYRGGTKIACEVLPDSKKLQFNIQEDRSTTHFSLIITSDISLQTSGTPTVDHLKVTSGKSYKFYLL